ncbi:acetyl-CoA carboxylase biotin carboxyl carrier protein [Collimonas silvisoli]|uniref:acetyl-CoA carboxylase biotin carboxyl carrier protein n=1 Tax=Collimonas silvisoli TaxID=2825884 RepID=UPI001B8C2054|nr:biotin/lipoyl-containing protein [Collimonas silvisoli]
MKIEKLRQITAWLEASDINYFEFTNAGQTVRLTLASNGRTLEQAVAPVEESPVSPSHAGSGRTAAVAASVGIFLTTHPLRSLPFTKVGDEVKKGNVLGLLKIGQIYAPVSAPLDGVVTGILMEHETAVDYGTRLIEILAAGQD